MFNSGLPESFCHSVTRQLESNCTLEMFKLQSCTTGQRGLTVVKQVDIIAVGLKLIKFII